MVLKWQRFHDKHHATSSANFVQRKVKTMTLPKTLEDMLHKARHLDKDTALIWQQTDYQHSFSCKTENENVS